MSTRRPGRTPTSAVTHEVAAPRWSRRSRRPGHGPRRAVERHRLAAESGRQRRPRRSPVRLATDKALRAARDEVRDDQLGRSCRRRSRAPWRRPGRPASARRRRRRPTPPSATGADRRSRCGSACRPRSPRRTSRLVTAPVEPAPARLREASRIWPRIWASPGDQRVEARRRPRTGARAASHAACARTAVVGQRVVLAGGIARPAAGIAGRAHACGVGADHVQLAAVAGREADRLGHAPASAHHRLDQAAAVRLAAPAARAPRSARVR